MPVELAIDFIAYCAQQRNGNNNKLARVVASAVLELHIVEVALERGGDLDRASVELLVARKDAARLRQLVPLAEPLAAPAAGLAAFRIPLRGRGARVSPEA